MLASHTRWGHGYYIQYCANAIETCRKNCLQGEDAFIKLNGTLMIFKVLADRQVVSSIEIVSEFIANGLEFNHLLCGLS